MRDHLSEVRLARECVVTAYTNLMCIDVPQMTETYEKNMEEQIEKAVVFEREIKKIITQYKIEVANNERKSETTSGFNTPIILDESEGSGQPEPKRPKGPEVQSRRSHDTGMPDVSRLNLNMTIPPYPPPPRPDRTDKSDYV